MSEDIKKEYEELKQRFTRLSERYAELEEEYFYMKARIDRLESSAFYKLSAPLRNVRRIIKQNITRLKNQGSVRGVIRKLKTKLSEKKALKSMGTRSFPDEERRKKEASEIFSKNPRFSILTPLYNTPERFLRDMIESVVNQTYQNWELCLTDSSDDNHAYVESTVNEYIDADKKLKGISRIKFARLKENKGISENTNAALELAGGDYIGLLDHDDILHPEVLYLYAKRIEEEGSDYLYCDETTFASKNLNHFINAHFKPEFAIDNLRANNYICHFSVFKRELLGDEKLLDSKYDGSQDHDMILRITDRAKHVTHVPRILYYWRSHSGSTAAGIKAKTYAIDSAKRAVSDHLKRKGFTDFKITSTKAFETIFKITYRLEETPKITIIIPNRDNREVLKRLIDSIADRSTYENYDILIVENNSREAETFKYYEELESGSLSGKIRVADYTGYKKEENGGFNFSNLVNYGVSLAEGKYIILLNNDTEVVSANWMEELLMYAQRSDVGAVGALLNFPNHTIQHAGVILGLGAHRTAGHSHYGIATYNLGYMGRLCYAQNVSAVTAACLMVSKEKYELAGGFDPVLAVSLNDVDFCLKLRQKGLLNVFTPFAVLTHYESMSRGLDLEGENARRYERESELFRSRWKEVLAKGDPYYNPNLTLDESDFSLRVL